MSNEGDSERRRTEQELRLLYRAVAASSNGITISDSKVPDDPLIYVNRSFELMTGYASEEVLGLASTCATCFNRLGRSRESA